MILGYLTGPRVLTGSLEEGDRRVRDRERLEHAALLALKMEEGTMSQ